MQNLLKIIAIIIFTNSSNSQTIDNLDNKFGFKTISFNSKKAKYEGLTSVDSESTNDLYQYHQNDTNLKKVFDEEFTDLFLSFNLQTSELRSIWLIEKINSIGENCFDVSLSKIEYLKNEYEKTIGKPSNIINNKKGFGYIWQGNKVKLTILISSKDAKINDNDQIETNCSIYVTFEKLDLLSSKSGF